MDNLSTLRRCLVLTSAVVVGLFSSTAFAEWKTCGEGYITSLSYNRDGGSNFYIVLTNMNNDGSNMSFSSDPISGVDAIRVKDKSKSASGNFRMLYSVVQSLYLAGSYVAVYSSGNGCDHGDDVFLVAACSSKDDDSCALQN